MDRAGGWTVVEALMVTAVVAILAAALPQLRDFLLDARMTSAVNGFVHAIHLARTQAQTGYQDVVVCRSANGSECGPRGDWASGWITFINRDQDDPAVVDPGETVLQVTGAQSLGSITSNRAAYVLRPATLRATNGTIVFCDTRGTRRARAVIVSYTGRPRVSDRTASGRPLTCPA
jgi:type IV fimbrial biogenesis protein FimT